MEHCDDDFRAEVRESFRSLGDEIKALAKQSAETNTTILMRGGIIDRLDSAEANIEKVREKSTETKAELTTIKAKVAFAAACVSALVAAVWTLFAHFWKPNP